jgi:hypothetical protein
MIAPDLAAATRSVKLLCERVAVSMTAIARQADTEFRDPRAVFVNVVLAIHDLEAAEQKLKKAWWP